MPLERRIIDFIEPFSYSATPYTATTVDPVVMEKRSKFYYKDSPVKLVCVGNMGVGKTCVVNRLCHNAFSTEYKGTIGVDFEVELFSVLQCPLKLQIWDTAGQERFRSIASAYFRGANVILAAFDLTDPMSLQSAEQWMLDAVDFCTHPLLFLVGCKRDLLDDVHYSLIEEKAIYMASTLRAEYWPCSAKTGIFIERLFQRIALLAMERVILSTVMETENPEKSPSSIGSDLPIQLNQDSSVGDQESWTVAARSDTKLSCCS